MTGSADDNALKDPFETVTVLKGSFRASVRVRWA
jgi:hypothetical protein